MPRNPALSEALVLACSRRAECDVTIDEARRALDNAESALSALGTAAMIVDVRAQRDRWLNIERELACLVGDDAPTLPAGEQGKVCPKCNGAGHTGEVLYGNVARACRTCNGTGAAGLPAAEPGKVCPTCKGHGGYYTSNGSKVCWACGGSGYVEIR